MVVPPVQNSYSVDMSNVTVATKGCDISVVNEETQSASPTPRRVKVKLNFVRRLCVSKPSTLLFSQTGYFASPLKCC